MENKYEAMETFSGWILGIEQIRKCSCGNWLQIPPGNSVHWRVRRGLYRNSQFGLFSPKIADVSWESDLVITFPDLRQGVDQGWLKRKWGEAQSRCPWPEYRGRRGTHHHESNREPWQAPPSLLTDSPHNPAWLWSLLVCFHPTSPISKMKLQDSGIDLSGHLNLSRENSHCAGRPSSVWISHLAYWRLSRQLSLSYIPEYLENPRCHILHPQVCSVSVMLKALSINVGSPEVDADFRDYRCIRARNAHMLSIYGERTWWGRPPQGQQDDSLPSFTSLTRFLLRQVKDWLDDSLENAR